MSGERGKKTWIRIQAMLEGFLTWLLNLVLLFYSRSSDAHLGKLFAG
jgi:hypothetical protein